MNKLKYYILTSGNLKSLHRHFYKNYSNIQAKDAVVVINTLDKEYERAASSWCKCHDIECHITESNGTAARGKNTLLEIFATSNDDYMVQIDGDDFITPHGKYVYETIASWKNPPDAVCLKNQCSIAFHSGQEFVWQPDPETALLYKWSFFFRTDWDKIKETSLLDHLKNSGVDSKTSKKYDDDWHEYYDHQKKWCEENEAHCRVTFLSKKAAILHKFPEHLEVGEDTIFYLMLKNDGLNGSLDVRCNDERPPTYIYDQTFAGVFMDVSNAGTNWDWMEVYNNEVKDMEKRNLLHSRPLPLLKINYDLEYKPNILNLPMLSTYTHPATRIKIEIPVNATEENVLKKLMSSQYK